MMVAVACSCSCSDMASCDHATSSCVQAMRPQPRSGFQWCLVPDDGGEPRALLFGGYCKEVKHKKLYDSSKSGGGKATGVSRPFPSQSRSILTEIYLCHACSCQEILRTETAGQESESEHGKEGGRALGRVQ
jgi:hypothetical protein|eukprot:SAG25_NODE_1219_length_3579_cov_4.935632_7_plen_132_part_00